MGAFQAVAESLGQTGEQAGQGINQALSDALKVRAQAHLEATDQAHIQLQQQAQQQAYTLAQQQHDLARQQLIQSGWKDLGPVLDPQTGQYSRNFYNENTKQYSKVPTQGVPPDSPQGLMSYYRTLNAMTGDDGKNLFTPLQAKQIAFKMPNLYREGPAGILQSFIDDAQDQADKGVKSIKIPGIGTFDITTQAGRVNFGQGALATIHPGGLYRALNPSGAGAAGKDLTGFTPGEAREFKAAEAGIDQLALMQERMSAAQMSTEMNPDTREQIKKDLNNYLISLENSKLDKYNEIQARRNPKANDPNKPLAGKMWSSGQWQTANPGKDVNAARAAAAQQGAIVVP